jgi:hypothetical protein
MATSRKRKRLSDAYRFEGFRPLEELHGVFGDPVARVVTLVRRSKKRAARDVVERAPFTIAERDVFAICRAAARESTWSLRYAGSDVGAMAP